MQEIIERLSTVTGVPASDVERALVAVLAERVKWWLSGEAHCAERKADDGAHERLQTRWRMWFPEQAPDADDVDPHRQWLNEWRETKSATVGSKMIATPARTVAGALAKITAAVEGGGLVENLEREAAEFPDGSAAMLRSAITDLNWIAGEPF